MRTLLVVAVGVTLLGQASWRPQASGVTARLRGASAVSEQVAWASGSGGTVLRTVDGGGTWTRHAVPHAERLDFRDVDAFSAAVAYVLSIGPGDASRIFKTIDGGEHWAQQFAGSDPRIFLDAMAFRDERHGFAFSDSSERQFVILRTADGGTHWERIPAGSLPPALEGEGAYAASGTNIAINGDRVWVGTTASRVLMSSDGGRSWSVAQTPVATGDATGIFSIAFRDARHGVVVGGNYRREREAVENAAWTADGGRTWTLAGNRGLSGFRSVVTAVPGTPSSFLAIGPSGADRSDDDGRTWKPVDAVGFHTFSFAAGMRTGWGAGENGRIARLDLER